MAGTHCCGSRFGVPDLGINDLIRSTGERGKGRREGRGALPLLRGLSLSEGHTEGFGVHSLFQKLVGFATAPAGKAGSLEKSRKCS